MEKQEFLDAIHTLFTKAESLIVTKNEDYSGDDVWKTFTLPEKLGISRTEQGIVIRMLDKISRLTTILANMKINHESFQDTCIDLMNYSALLSVYVQDKNTQQPTKSIVPPEIPQTITIHYPEYR